MKLFAERRSNTGADRWANIFGVMHLNPGYITDESNSTENPPWAAHSHYERSHSKLRVVTSLARRSGEKQK